MKKYVIVIPIIILIAIGSYFLFFNKKEENSDYEGNKIVLVEQAYSNMAFGYSFQGTAIFDDGSVYTWNVNEPDGNVNSREGLTNFILKHGTKQGEVTKDDIVLIRKLVNELKDYELETTCHGADIGSYLIMIFAGDRGTKIKESGDCDGVEENENVSQLITIISKYM